jgi:hypothetical protein
MKRQGWKEETEERNAFDKEEQQRKYMKGEIRHQKEEGMARQNQKV